MLVPIGLPRTPARLMAFLLGYFDESGKFRDHDVVTFCGFAADLDGWQRFQDEWEYLLRHNGLTTFHTKDLLNHRRNLSKRVSAVGLEARTDVINQFVRAIKKTLEVGIASSVDARAFRELNSTEQELLRHPHYLAFRLALLDLYEYINGRANDQMAITCDDEEMYSTEVYKIFTRLRTEEPKMRERFISISFADDRFFPQLQAADLFASIARQRAAHEFHGVPFEYEEISREFMLKTPEDRIRRIRGHFLNKDNLQKLAAGAAERKAIARGKRDKIPPVSRG